MRSDPERRLGVNWNRSGIPSSYQRKFRNHTAYKVYSLFREMLSAGRKRPWKQILYHLTGEREMSADALLEYFAPLRAWLFKYRSKHGYPIGWQETELKNVTGTASGVRKTLPDSTPDGAKNAKVKPANGVGSQKGSSSTSHAAKDTLNGVTFPEAKNSNDVVNLGKPNLKAALDDMGSVLKAQAKGTSLLHAKSSILGSGKPMFVPNKMKDQLNLGHV